MFSPFFASTLVVFLPLYIMPFGPWAPLFPRTSKIRMKAGGMATGERYRQVEWEHRSSSR